MKPILWKIIEFFYKAIYKNLAFLRDPETVHDGATSFGKKLGNSPVAKGILSSLLVYKNKMLEQEIGGIKFENPIGLAAGFDKNANLTQILGSVGFGYEEVGSVSGTPAEGNPKPRLWRLKKSKGIIVWYGLTNDGSEKLAQKLGKLKFDIPIGVSIVKTNSPEVLTLERAVPDIIKAFKDMADIGSYYTLNISCPNTEGEGLFYNAKNLKVALKEIFNLNIKKPLFIKMPPDLCRTSIDEIIDISRKYGIKGFVLSNIVKHRDMMKSYDKEELSKIDPGKGSISGKPVEDLSNKLIEYVYKKTRGEFIIIGCGGIFTAKDAYKKIRLGASLLQLITGMIFEGPQRIAQINYGLVKLLKKDGFKNISEAVGADIN